MSPFPKDPGPPDYGACLCSPAELKASHDRCRDLQVPVELERPQKILPKSMLDPRTAKNSFLLTAVERVIDLHHYTRPQKNHIYILCDPELVVLKIFAASEVLSAVEEVGVKPGTAFTEESCGTNALALACELNRLVAVRGDQHYCRLFKDWWCVASPIKDPGGKILGYLNISMHAEMELGLAAALLQTLITSIERELYLRELERKLQNACLTLPSSLALPPEVERELTLREREVVHLLLCRLSNKEIAKKLHLSIRTVRKHRQNVYQKLCVSSLDGLLSRFNPE